MFEAICSFYVGEIQKTFSIFQAFYSTITGSSHKSIFQQIICLILSASENYRKFESTEDQARKRSPKMPVNKYGIENSELSERLAIYPKG